MLTPALAASVDSKVSLPVVRLSAELLSAGRVAANFGTVTSARRSVEHNKRVGGVATSYHLTGRAIDVQRRPGVTHQMIDAALHRAGFVLVESLDENDHSHFAFANALPLSAFAYQGANAPPAGPPDKPLRRQILADDHGVLIVAASSLAIEKELQPK